MSVLRPSLSRRVGLALVAAALLLIGTLVAAPSVSSAPPARVKQFTASLSAGAGSSLTVTVTNCGGPTLPSECTAPSTIGLGAVQIAVPTGFQPASNVHASSGSTTWTNAGYNPATKSVEAISPGGTNKLNPGQTLVVTFNVPTTATCEGTNEFTTKAWGANAIAGSDPFEIKSSQPTVVCSGGTVTGPGGQTETVSGDFEGALIVTFGGDLDCSFDTTPVDPLDPDGPTLGDQWSQFHLPTQVNIIPGPGFVGHGPKTSTSRFPTEGDDSSSYLICWAGLDTFNTRSGFPLQVVEIGGTDFFVGILPNCYNPTTEPPGINPPPCVSEQFLDLTTDEIVISVRMPPGDPHKR
jgi:hypothetical protein